MPQTRLDYAPPLYHQLEPESVLLSLHEDVVTIKSAWFQNSGEVGLTLGYGLT
jgi:hypothetical protein